MGWRMVQGITAICQDTKHQSKTLKGHAQNVSILCRTDSGEISSQLCVGLYGTLVPA